MSLRCAVEVVGTEDLLHLCTVECDVDVAAHEGLDTFHCLYGRHIIVVTLRADSGRCHYGFTPQAAAVGTAVDGATIEINFCLLRAVKDQFAGRTASVGVAQSGAAINIAVERNIACVDIAGLRTDVHRHVALDQRRLTLTTAEDHVIGFIFRAHRAAEQRHRGILLQHTVDVGTAIDGFRHRAAFHIDGGIAEVLGCHIGMTSA